MGLRPSFASIDGVQEGRWVEVFTSDAALHGGWNDGNKRGVRASRSGRFTAIVSGAGVVPSARL